MSTPLISSSSHIHIKSVNGRLFFIKAWTLRNRFVILLNTFLFNDRTIFAAVEFTVEFSFADCLPTDLICCPEVSWEITDSILKLEDPVTKTAFLSKSEEAYCMQTEHVIRSISRISLL